MALKKCKECSKEISPKAKTCPNCGAPQGPKQYSVGKLIVLILFGLFMYALFTADYTPTTTSSKQWFQGGNLHNATVAQWKSATYKNKLATASDWLAATKWKGHLNSPDDFDKIKVKAQMLVKAVDEVVTVKQTDSMQVNEIAAAIVTMSNDIGP